MRMQPQSVGILAFGSLLLFEGIQILPFKNIFFEASFNETSQILILCLQQWIFVKRDTMDL